MRTDDGSSNRPSSSIVVVSYNTAAYIEACLMSLLELDYPDVEIIVVDNASSDGSAAKVRAHFPDVEVVELPDNKGFAGGASVGLYMASGDIVATVNPDVRLDPGWLAAVAETLDSESDTGIVGSKILYPDGKTLQHAGGLVHYPLATTEHIGRGEIDAGQYNYPREVSFVTGAALAMWRDLGRNLSFFDEDFYPVYYEDVDLCWRARKEGVQVVYQPRAVAYHHESVTMNRESGQYYTYYHANRLRFVTKHYSPEQVMLDFLPAEAARVSEEMPPEDRKASLALLDIHSGRGTVRHNLPSTQHELDIIQKNLKEVMSGWRVREKPFRSSVPVLGRLIVSLRERINNLSTRWYVQPILQQQVEYNASVARTLREISRQLADLQARVRLEALLTAGLVSSDNGMTMQQLSSEIESLRSRIEQIELPSADVSEDLDVAR